MYKDYGFVLNFDELDPGLQDEKILNYINFHAIYEEEDTYRDIEKVPKRIYDRAKREIEARFPMYF